MKGGRQARTQVGINGRADEGKREGRDDGLIDR